MVESSNLKLRNEEGFKNIFYSKIAIVLIFHDFPLRLLLFFNDFNCYYYTRFINGRENTLNCCHCFTHFIDGRGKDA